MTGRRKKPEIRNSFAALHPMLSYATHDVRTSLSVSNLKFVSKYCEPMVSVGQLLSSAGAGAQL